MFHSVSLQNKMIVSDIDEVLLLLSIGFRGGQMVDMNIVTVYDIQNKFIAYSAPVPDVIDVLCEWGSLYILGGDRKVTCNLALKWN